MTSALRRGPVACACGRGCPPSLTRSPACSPSLAHSLSRLLTVTRSLPLPPAHRHSLTPPPACSPPPAVRSNHPGSPLLEEGPWGRGVLRTHGAAAGVLWSGGGASEDGARPFVDLRAFADGTHERRLWRGAVGCYDALKDVLTPKAAAQLAPDAVARGAELVLISIRQTQTEPPSVRLRAVDADSAAMASADPTTDESRIDTSAVLATLTAPDHPQPALRGVSKSLLKYERSDGVALSGTLYTPAGYDAAVDGPLPTILWAYPREFKSKASAGQASIPSHLSSSPLPCTHLIHTCTPRA
jgi:hypothetical protein